MLAIALDLPPLPMDGAALTTLQAQVVVAPPDHEDGRLDWGTYSYVPGSAVTAHAVQGEVVGEPTQSYEPSTALGRRLLALRKSYLDNGGKLLSLDELDAEMEARRGGLGDG